MDSFKKDKCNQCFSSDTIIQRPHVCNGIIDCPDLSDECLCEDSKVAICKDLKQTISTTK